MFKLSKMDKYGKRWSPNRTVSVRATYHTNTLGGHTPRISHWLVTNHAKDETISVPTLERARETAEWMALANNELPVLTPAQAKALKMIREDEEFYSYNGINRNTIRRLEELGLIEVKWSTVRVQRGVLSTNRYYWQLEWVAKPKAV